MVDMKRIVVLGPSNRSVVQDYIGDNYNAWLKELAETTLGLFSELIFMPDDGVYVDFALAFQEAGGKITAIIPSEDESFIKMAQRYTKHYMTLPNATGWSYLNTHLVGLGTDAICLGYSAGSILEIASIKYIEKYNQQLINLYVDTRVCSAKLPIELERELSNVKYFKTAEEYAAILLGGTP